MISNIPQKFKEIIKALLQYDLSGETFYEMLNSFASMFGVTGSTVNELLFNLLTALDANPTPGETTYVYLRLLVYALSETRLQEKEITSKYILLQKLYDLITFDRDAKPNRMVYTNDVQLTDSKYRVGATFCGGVITAHVYNDVLKEGAIEFDRTITAFEADAFRNTLISYIDLPTEVVTIGDNAFFQCYYLADYQLNLPATITTIGDYAFASTDIRELRVPAGTTSIGHAAFTGVKNIVYTGTATYYQNDPYWGAKMVNGVWERRTGNLYSADGTIFAWVGYPDYTTSLTVASGVTTIGRDAVRNCTHLTSVNLPSSLTTIQAGAFMQCPQLPSIVIPSGVTSIGAFAFSGDTSLTITMLPTVPPTLAGSSEFTGVQRILVPESSYNDYITAWSQWSSIIDIIQVPLNFTANEANSTVSLGKSGTLDTSYEYSTDNVTWTPYNIGDTITLANVGDKVYFRGDNKDVVFGRLNYMNFVILGSVVGDGNIMSILDPTMQLDTAPTYCFTNLFSICHGLIKAPKLPAINLSPYCYRYMFQNCINLTEAPELPATTLSDSCYQYMFQGCTSLTTVPALTATTLENRSYMGMFRTCRSLTELTVYTNDITANQCLRYWLDETASGTTGILHSLGSADFTGQVPSNWNITEHPTYPEPSNPGVPGEWE